MIQAWHYLWASGRPSGGTGLRRAIAHLDPKLGITSFRSGIANRGWPRAHARVLRSKWAPSAVIISGMTVILVRNRINIFRNPELENFMSGSTSKDGKPPFTHTAWILKTELIRKGRRVGRR